MVVLLKNLMLSSNIGDGGMAAYELELNNIVPPKAVDRQFFSSKTISLEKRRRGRFPTIF